MGLGPSPLAVNRVREVNDFRPLSGWRAGFEESPLLSRTSFPHRLPVRGSVFHLKRQSFQGINPFPVSGPLIGPCSVKKQHLLLFTLHKKAASLSILLDGTAVTTAAAKYN